MITIELLQALCPKTKKTILEGYLEPLNTVAEYYEMTANPARLAGFLAQTAHESGGFNFIKENLNYSAKGLMTIFKKYFPNEDLANQSQSDDNSSESSDEEIKIKQNAFKEKQLAKQRQYIIKYNISQNDIDQLYNIIEQLKIIIRRIDVGIKSTNALLQCTKDEFSNNYNNPLYMTM